MRLRCSLGGQKPTSATQQELLFISHLFRWWQRNTLLGSTVTRLLVSFTLKDACVCVCVCICVYACMVLKPGSLEVKRSQRHSRKLPRQSAQFCGRNPPHTHHHPPPSPPPFVERSHFKPPYPGANPRASSQRMTDRCSRHQSVA